MANQSCKKTFFVRYPDIQLKNVRILYLLNFAIIWPIKLNKCLFSSQFSSFGVELFQKSTVLEPFYAKNAKFSCNYLKMSGFSSRNVRYPRYQDTAFLQLCVRAWAMPHTLYVSCGIPFPVLTSDKKSGLSSGIFFKGRGSK